MRIPACSVYACLGFLASASISHAALPLRGVSGVSAGGAHTCALTVTGGVLCWGDDSAGQLGDGLRSARATPTAVVGLSTGATAVSAGSEYTCALATGGRAKCWGLECWGDNAYGQLGDGTTIDRLTPVSVSGVNGATMIAAGDLHACALAGGGMVCWGDNGNGQLGNGTTTASSVPVGVSGLASGIAAISAGSDFDHSCALLVGGTVRCWGEYYFPIGGIFPVASTHPLDRGFSGAVAMSAGGAGYVLTAHVCAVGTDGGVRCQGGNHYGQLGDGAPGGYADTPVEVVLSEVIFSDGFD